MKAADYASLVVAVGSIVLVVLWPGAHGPSVLLGIFIGIVGLRAALQLFALYSRVSAQKSTMGPDGDAIVGFEARVVTVEPLQVEVLGSVWRAHLVAGAPVLPEERVRIVRREVLTLFVARDKDLASLPSTGKVRDNS